MQSQGWRARASERHLQAWGASFGYTVRVEKDLGRVRYHLAPNA
jgi:hypothetical protein